jgi:phospholipid/cholesterol/gamma-HCH transport system substrate-binding protein
MNNFFRNGNGNKRTAFFILIFIFFVFSLWFFIHPSSPYYSKTKYVLRFSEIGSLSPGNHVQVNGLVKGKIKKVDITDDYIFVTIEILSDMKIPTNSKIRLVSAGFLGEREVFIGLGTSSEFFNPLDTINGIYDKGITGIKENVSDCLAILGNMSQQVQVLSDSLLGGETGKNIDRVQNKGSRLVSTAKKRSNEWADQAQDLLTQINGMADKLSRQLKTTKKDLDMPVSAADSLLNQLKSLKDSASKVKSAITNLSEKLKADDNTVALMLAEKNALSKTMDTLAHDIKALTTDIKKNGIRFNVDIF